MGYLLYIILKAIFTNLFKDNYYYIIYRIISTLYRRIYQVKIVFIYKIPKINLNILNIFLL